MTNAADFRRYSYNTDTSYANALDAFNATRSVSAPEMKPQRKRAFTIRPNTKRKSKAQLIAEQKASFRHVVVVLTVTVLSLSMLFGVVYTFVQKSELTHSISKSKSAIAIANSENVSLNSELEAMVSMSQIDLYAVEKLGMVKLQPNQIRYIDTSEFKEVRSASVAEEQSDGTADASAE